MTVQVRAVDGGCVLAVRVRAGAPREELRGEHGGALKLSVNAAPERGKANKAVLELLSSALELPASRLGVLRGETSPDKQILVQGLAPEELKARIERALATGSR